MTNIEFLRSEVNGVEFFTLVATGESGMSQRGLARACGTALFAIQNLVKQLTNGKPPKRLERFVGIDLKLTNGLIKTGKRGAGAVAYKSTFCSAVIKHYASKGHEVAQDFDDALGDIGLTSYIQGVTGWLPAQYEAVPAASAKLSRILDEPSPWVRLYEKSFCDRVFNWYGAQFYWQYAYFSLTDQEICKLNVLNPAINGDRDFRIHQYLESETKDRLRAYLVELTRMVDMAPDKQTFEAMYQHYFQRNTQLRLF